MHKALSLQDLMVKKYIDQIFLKYDVDKSGALDSQQLTLFYRDLFHILNVKIQISETMVKQVMHVIDINNDGVIQKEQLQEAFKIILKVKKPKVCNNQQISLSEDHKVSRCQISLNSNSSFNPQMSLSYSEDSTVNSHFTPTTSKYIRDNAQIKSKFKSQNNLKPPQICFKRTQSQIKNSQVTKSPVKTKLQQF